MGQETASQACFEAVHAGRSLQTLTNLRRALHGGPYVQVIPERGCEQEAGVLAHKLRALGQTTNCFYSGNPNKLFKKAKASGASQIVTVGEYVCRFWSKANQKGCDLATDQVERYYAFMCEEGDTLPEPVDVFKRFDRAGFYPHLPF